jgi:hypothetical protein
MRVVRLGLLAAAIGCITCSTVLAADLNVRRGYGKVRHTAEYCRTGWWQTTHLYDHPRPRWGTRCAYRTARLVVEE